MKTLYITNNSNILIDTENNSCNTLRCDRGGVNDVFLVDEPMHIVYGYGEHHRELDAEAGDIIITFYSDFINKLIIVKNEDWKNNLIDYRKQEEEEKLRWAAQKNCEACDQCDCKSLA